MAGYSAILATLDQFEESDEETGDADAGDQECAWCLSAQGIVPTSGSHGICTEHANGMKQQAEERRRNKRR